MTLKFHEECTDQDLDRIERLLDAATDGPWYSYVVGRDVEAGSNCIEVGACNELGSFKSIEIVAGTVADQDFIASARQDLPKLLLEVRRLRSCLESLRDAQISVRLQSSRSVVEGAALSA